ncbi:hypothetical protein HXS80_16020 [Streptomyces sp. CB04723]|uniref:hypothetical protein n=1 Tax=Streptomyces TaxID=1883 RepID=UPI0015C473D9|nr:hypothetical protein [Streptomyces sp. CB04723]QLG33034.1 hypothetical protein HXS80_16020 [Streptomyces sp. CB04723]
MGELSNGTRLSDHEVRERLREHQDGGVISALFETGEVGEGIETALSLRMDALEDDGRHDDAERLGDVLTYVCDVLDRPPVANWVNR